MLALKARRSSPSCRRRRQEQGYAHFPGRPAPALMTVGRGLKPACDSGDSRHYSSLLHCVGYTEKTMRESTVEILLIEDNDADIDLFQEALKSYRVSCHLSVLRDGNEALAFLRREGPYATAPRPAL